MFLDFLESMSIVFKSFGLSGNFQLAWKLSGLSGRFPGQEFWLVCELLNFLIALKLSWLLWKFPDIVIVSGNFQQIKIIFNFWGHFPDCQNSFLIVWKLFCIFSILFSLFENIPDHSEEFQLGSFTLPQYSVHLKPFKCNTIASKLRRKNMFIKKNQIFNKLLYILFDSFKVFFNIKQIYIYIS